MTYEEALDQVAKKAGYFNWLNLEARLSKSIEDVDKLIVSYCDEAAKLYAKSKWDEACETVNKMQAGGVYVNKPEFKP